MSELSWQKVKDAGSVIVTVLLAVMVGGWLIATALQLGKAISYDQAGHVLLDTFGRAKDVLVLLLPFLTTAVGFWLGTQNTGQLERQIDEANTEADRARSAALDARGDIDSFRDDITAARVEAARLEGQVEFWRYRAIAAEERADSAEEQIRSLRRGRSEDEEEAVKRTFELGGTFPESAVTPPEPNVSQPEDDFA